MKTVNTTPLEYYRSDNYNERGENPCVLCGKNIGNNPKYFVHLLNTGDLISSDEDFEESQGLFPIGNECRKKLPKGFVFKK